MPILQIEYPRYVEHFTIGESFKSIAFDGNHFYISHPKSSTIYMLDNRLRTLDLLKTQLQFSNICYDGHNKCFWASDPTYKSILFMLDKSMNIISDANIKQLNKFSEPVSGISYNYGDNSLMVSFKSRISTFFPFKDLRQSKCYFLNELSHAFITDIFCISPILLVISIRSFKQYIDFYKLNSSFKHFQSLELPNNYFIEDIIFVPSKELSIKHNFYMLCIKDGVFPCICKLELDCDKFKIDFCNYL